MRPGGGSNIQMLRCAAAGIALLGVCGCAEPFMEGRIPIAPGATERLLLAMHLGYGGAGEAKPPAEARLIAGDEDLLEGPAARGRRGDYELTNGSVVAIIAAPDHTARGGHLVDLGREDARQDELDVLGTEVGGERVVYETIKRGSDAATGAAYVEVSGRSERSQLAVATRYDLAPELDAVLVHTTFTPTAEMLKEPEQIAVADALRVPAGTLGRRSAGPDYVDFLGAHAGYALRPLVDEAARGSIVVDGDGGGVGLRAGGLAAGAVVYSRMVAPLARPDTLALDALLALADGRELGEIEVDVAPAAARSTPAAGAGKLLFVSSSEPPAEMAVARGLRPGDTVSAPIPSGTWSVAYESGSESAEAVSVTIPPRQIAAAHLISHPH